MHAIRLRHPASLDNLRLETAEAAAPGPGEIKIFFGLIRLISSVVILSFL